jgi:hypothetical protein
VVKVFEENNEKLVSRDHACLYKKTGECKGGAQGTGEPPPTARQCWRGREEGSDGAAATSWEPFLCLESKNRSTPCRRQGLHPSHGKRALHARILCFSIFFFSFYCLFLLCFSPTHHAPCV